MTLDHALGDPLSAPKGRGATAFMHSVLASLLILLGAMLAPPALANNEVSTDGEPIVVELNEGKLIRLEKPANSVFIANPGIADISVKSARLVYLFGSRPGETTLFAVDEEDEVVANLKVVVNHNISRLTEALERLVPDGSITATSIDGAIVLSGKVDNATQSENVRRLARRFIGENEEIINQLGVTAPNQINLRVRVAEVSRTIVNQFGINWDAAVQTSDFIFGLATGNLVTVPTLPASPTANSFITRPGVGVNSLFFSGSPGNFDVNGLIDLLEQDGLVTVLAEPNLTALSGETANFLAGGEFPIPVPQRNGNFTIQFKQFGVSLAFTPTVIGNNRISMRVAPEVSQLSNTGAITIQTIQVPALTTRRAETTVELGSGQSFAIAGLLLDNTLQNTESVPGLSDLPILGPLFDSDRFERNESELVIIVTPYVVKPVASEDMLALPTDPYLNVEPSPAERDVAQSPAQPQTIPLNTGAPTAGGPTRPSGFIVE